MGSREVKMPKKKAKKGELSIGDQRQAAVEAVTEKLYEKYLGMESGFVNSRIGQGVIDVGEGDDSCRKRYVLAF